MIKLVSQSDFLIIKGKKKTRWKWTYLSNTIPITSTNGNEDMSLKDSVKMTNGFSQLVFQWLHSSSHIRFHHSFPWVLEDFFKFRGIL